MIWYAISGSWRTINKEVEKDVRLIVKKIIKKGDGIITGGALGVDYIATQEVIKNKKLNLIKIFLPINLKSFCKHYEKRAKEGIISFLQAENICRQLIYINNNSPNSIMVSGKFEEASEKSYYSRNSDIVKNCDKLYAFQVNDSKGTQDAIIKARELGKEVFVKKYKI